jgi:hypothetical protein
MGGAKMLKTIEFLQKDLRVASGTKRGVHDCALRAFELANYIKGLIVECHTGCRSVWDTQTYHAKSYADSHRQLSQTGAGAY